jgi:serine/threonine protein kinase
MGTPGTRTGMGTPGTRTGMPGTRMGLTSARFVGGKPGNNQNIIARLVDYLRGHKKKGQVIPINPDPEQVLYHVPNGYVVFHNRMFYPLGKYNPYQDPQRIQDVIQYRKNQDEREIQEMTRTPHENQARHNPREAYTQHETNLVAMMKGASLIGQGGFGCVFKDKSGLNTIKLHTNATEAEASRELMKTLHKVDINGAFLAKPNTLVLTHPQEHYTAAGCNIRIRGKKKTTLGTKTTATASRVYEYIVYTMPYAEHGDLSAYSHSRIHTETGNLRHVMYVMHDAFCGARLLYDNGIIHGDVKSENVLVYGKKIGKPRDHVKLNDYKSRDHGKLNDYDFLTPAMNMDVEHIMNDAARYFVIPPEYILKKELLTKDAPKAVKNAQLIYQNRLRSMCMDGIMAGLFEKPKFNITSNASATNYDAYALGFMMLSTLTTVHALTYIQSNDELYTLLAQLLVVDPKKRMHVDQATVALQDFIKRQERA